MEWINWLIPIAFGIAGLVLAYLLFELAKLVSTTRNTLTTITEDIKPIMEDAHGVLEASKPVVENLDTLTKTIEPTLAKTEPMLERLTLTVDAANLELMRVDKILEDVGEMTGSLANTTKTIDTVTNAPVNMVTSAANKIRDAFGAGDGKASDLSVAIGEGRREEEAAKDSQ